MALHNFGYKTSRKLDAHIDVFVQRKKSIANNDFRDKAIER